MGRANLKAHDLALAEGKGVTLVDGKLVRLHVAEAQRLVELDRLIKHRENIHKSQHYFIRFCIICEVLRQFL